MYFISQLGQHDCAFACLTMVLANYHHDKNYLFLQREDKTRTFKDLIVIAESFNMNLEGIEIDSVGELSQCKRFPLITNIEVAKNTFHSVLITKANRKMVYFFDPSVGKRMMTVGEFEQVWSKKALAVKDYTKTSCPVTAPTFIDKKDKMILPIWQLLSGISLLVGSYFINRYDMIYVPIIFFSLFVIFEIMFRDSLVKAMRNMDSEIARYHIKVDNSQYFDFYSNCEKYRQFVLALTPNVIYTMLVSIFLTVIIALNGTLNLIYIAVALSLGAIKALLVNPYIEHKSKVIELDEREIKLSKNEEEFNHYAQIAREKAYRTSLIKNVFSYLGIALLLITIVMVMALSQVYSATYVVFYLCISIYLKNNFSNVFDFKRQEEESDNYRNKIINSLNIDE